mgnify:CR=1 FL=1
MASLRCSSRHAAFIRIPAPYRPLHAHEGACHEVPQKHDADVGLYGTGIKILWRFWRGIGYDGEGKAEYFPLGLVLKWILIG